jgi:hypothetical protein
MDMILGSVPTPSENCCMLFSDTNYNGYRQSVCHYGEEKYDELWRDPWDFNNMTQSFVCGKNVKITFCDNLEHTCDHKNSSAGRVDNPDIGDFMRGKMSSLKIEPYDRRHYGAANLFEHWNCNGKQAAFEYRGSGGHTKYTLYDMEHAGLPDDTLSSVMVPLGYVLEVYRDDGNRGPHRTIVGAQDAEGYMQCYNLSDFNNETSSLKVRRIAAGNAIGYWEGLTASET